MTDATIHRKEAARHAPAETWVRRGMFESALIVISILVALAVGEWREDEEVKERVLQARQYFAQEIAANREKLASDRYLPHHMRARDGWREVLQTGDFSEAGTAEARAVVNTGYHPMTFKDAVWRSVSGGDLLSNMAPEDVFLVADVYSAQEALDEINSSMMTAWRQPGEISDDPRSKRQGIEVTRSWLEDVIYAERELLKMYDKALLQLRRPPADD